MTKKEERKQRQAERASKGEIEAPTTTTVTAKTAKAKPVDSPAVAAAKAALADARRAERPVRTPRPKPEPRPTCTGTKANGEPCTAKSKGGSDRCIDHQPAWERLTESERTTFEILFEAAEASDLVQELGWHRAKQVIKDGGFGQ